MNVIIIIVFETEWKFIQKIYNRYNIVICVYLTKKWIVSFKIKFIRYYINQKFHFFNVVNFKGESDYTILKRELRFSIDKRFFAFILI